MARLDLDSEEWTNLVLSVNTHRTVRRLSPAEVALLIQRALWSYDKAGLADALGLRDASMVGRFDALNQLDPDLRELVEWGSKPGSVSMSVASELAPIRPRGERRKAFKAALDYGLSKRDAQQLKQSHRREFGDMDDCIRAALNAKPRVERTEVIVGAINDDKVQQVLQSMPPVERAAAFEGILSEEFPSVRRLGSVLNVRYFSISLDPEDSEELRNILGNETLENAVSRLLRERAPCK